MQPIFSKNPDFEKIAFLNWRIDEDNILNMMNMANGFLLSSIELSKHCLINNDDKRADILIFPILTNANHGIELYLKAILWTLNKLLGSNKDIEGNHNIKQIFYAIISRLEKYNGNISLKDFNKSMKPLKSYIDELFQKINSTPQNDRMDFSRYPFTRNDENHFYVDVIGVVEIDLENFISRFSIIHKELEKFADFLYHQELNQDW